MFVNQTGKKSYNRNVLLILTMASHFFNPFMGSSVNVALKSIGTEFSMSAVGLSWVTMSYLLSSAIFLVPFGKTGDIWGRTKMFLYGNIFFAVTTLLCGFATNAPMLITMRLIQGVASAMMVSTTMALIISAFPPQDRGKVIGFNVSAVYIGSSLAPVIGGYLTDVFSWRSIFFINFIVSTIISLVIIWQIKQEIVEPVKEKFDFKGTMVYMLSISMLMYGFSKLPLIHAVILTFAGIIGLIAFVKIELKTGSPVLNIKLFTENKIFAFSNLTALINYAATFGLSFMLSLYLQYAKGMEARQAGLVLMAQPIMMAIVASFSGRLSDRKNPRVLAAIGMAVSATGMLILSFIDRETNITYIIAGLIVLGFGFGMFSSPNTNVVMSSVDKKVYGSASATLATMRSTGMMFSMAIASLSMHLFLGNAKISMQNLPAFITSTKIVFTIFTVLCFVGVFFSLVKRNVHK